MKYYINSYGQDRPVPKVVTNLRNRKDEAVFPEVVELLQRIKRRQCGSYAYVSVAGVALELNIRPSTIARIFRIMVQKGTLVTSRIAKIERDNAPTLLRVRSLFSINPDIHDI